MDILHFLNASMLGDGYIRLRSDHGCKNASYSIAQTSTKIDYVNWIYSILRKNMNVRVYYYDYPITKNGWNAKPHFRLETGCSALCTEVFDKWYGGKKKHVPEDIILDWQSLSIWIMDDGTNNYARKSYELYTLAFNDKDLAFLQKALYRDLNIRTSINKHHGSKIIRIPTSEYYTVQEGIKPYIFPCFNYKAIDKALVKFPNIGEHCDVNTEINYPIAKIPELIGNTRRVKIVEHSVE